METLFSAIPAIVRYKKIVLALCLLFSATLTVRAQSVLRLQQTEMSVREVFEQLQRQTRYRFAYDSHIFDLSRRVSFTERELPVVAILEQLLDGSGFKYVVVDEMIVISPAPKPEEPPLPPPPPAVEPEEPDPGPMYYTDPDTGDTYIPSEANAFSAAPRRRNPESSDAIELRIDPRAKSVPFTSHTLPLYAYLPEGLPSVLFKTNALHWAAGVTPNLGVDIGLGRHTSIELYGANNSWDRQGPQYNNRKMVHWMARVGFRYWICERFKNLSVGADVTYGQFNISGYNIPFLFDREYRNEGQFASAGVSLGYDLLLTRWMNLQFCVGAGVYLMDYNKFDCEHCDTPAAGFRGARFGLTRAGVNLVFTIK